MADLKNLMKDALKIEDYFGEEWLDEAWEEYILKEYFWVQVMHIPPTLKGYNMDVNMLDSIKNHGDKRNDDSTWTIQFKEKEKDFTKFIV